MYIKLNKSFFYLTFLCILILSTFSIEDNTQTKSIQQLEYEKLNQQQKSLQDTINNLVEDMLQVQKNVSKSTSGQQKVLLLQQAILSQRQKIFNIRNEIIPPFSLSKTACMQLSNQQKIDILDKINSTKQQLTALQKSIVAAPKCDKTTNLQKDALKQLTLLQSLQKTIYTQCKQKSILTPTIYQTNVYANGWILGDQHIDDLVQEYYQRNIKYHNITNCPLETPFYNGRECMICKEPNPVFNILTRQCTRCPEDQQPDPNIRQCAWEPHYTNFSWVDNWAQEGAPMPVPKRELLPCPQSKPYYNGKKCEICQMPKYWSIKKNACVQCPPQMIFDLNTKNCQKPENNDLTILQGTRWVTNDCNLTRIVNDRINVLNINKTKHYYRMCPASKPFFDGIVCISCPNQFNIDSRKCVSKPNITSAYDQNMRCYLQKQVGFQTDPRADNYTTQSPLVDTPTPNCRKATPYYDGIACIKCLQPFPIFDVPSRRCTNCDPMQIYINAQHKCVPRPRVYVSTNDQRLLATPNMSIDDYHEEIRRKIDQDPTAVVLLCKGMEYSDYKHCFNCSDNQYFNVQTKRCQICDGTVNKQTRICSQKAYLYTNINQDSAKRIKAVPPNTTLEKQNATITQNLRIHSNARLCPQDAPYFDLSACTNCTDQIFNYTSKKCGPLICDDPKLPFYNKQTKQCQQCPKGMRYDESAKICQPIVYVTNTNAIYYYIQEDNYTKANLEEQIFRLQANNSVTTCDASHPYWNGTDCIECAITRNKEDMENFKPYFNLRSLKCEACDSYDNQTHRCKDRVACRQPTPVLDPETNTCLPCPNGTVWNPATSTCVTCEAGQIYNETARQCQRWFTNPEGLNNNNYIQQNEATKDRLSQNIEEARKNQTVYICPVETPFFSPSEGRCINCVDPTPYFNLYSQTCVKCDHYDEQTHTCQEGVPRFKMNVQDFYSTIFG